ncbi:MULTISPECIES: hypothetical protein [unclassified Streptomyces]|uniref:hypothetical protein n=1 Tax=unclassified Streptomyces TaxID=2593676 RepID=UPI002E2A24E9|nr:hypothetical protein [Streptomyces sp. NBC_00223]
MAAAAYPEDDDALFVLTAALLTPGRFPGVLGDDYPAACAELGLDPQDDGYGLVFGQDAGGARWTVATTDTAAVACALAAWDCGLEYELSPDEDTSAATLPGWPLPVAVAAPGLPAPYDPDEETGGGPALTPPDTAQWGPAQRRLGADDVALHWRQWRDGLDTLHGDISGGPGDSVPDGAPDAAGPPGAVSHLGVRRALAQAEEYVRQPPPPGRVRTAYGAVRADGPGWSLVGRTDDMAFVLLDDAPGEVLPVGRGPALPALLDALTRLAAAPVAAASS